MQTPVITIPLEYKLGFHDEIKYLKKVGKGINKGIVEQISGFKKESNWMRNFRLKSFDKFLSMPVPGWGGDLSNINFDMITYYLSPTEKKANLWSDLPAEIKKTYEKIGMPRMEKEMLAGVEAQYDSESIYSSIKKNLENKGVLFTDTDTALKKYPGLFLKYFGKLIPPTDNKFAALNSAFWSGGSFIYVPKNIKVDLPMQAYFRINAREMGQFERTLIIADEGCDIKYVEGCSAPVYSTDSLHAAVVEIFLAKGAKVQYTTIQNWSSNVYNLVTKRARVEEGADMRWLDVNIGSKITMKYPSCYLVGKGAKGEMVSLSIAGKGQNQDTGAKMVHNAPETTSNVISKSVSHNKGKTVFRGLTKISENSRNAKAKSKCEALIIGNGSTADAFPALKVDTFEATATHEASVSRLEDQQLFYLQSRGLSREEAESLIVNGFAEDIVKQLPLEYAVEIRRLLAMHVK